MHSFYIHWGGKHRLLYELDLHTEGWDLRLRFGRRGFDLAWRGFPRS